jgi:hypothetical protein
MPSTSLRACSVSMPSSQAISVDITGMVVDDRVFAVL